VFTKYSQILSNTHDGEFVVKNTLVWRGFVGISRDYPLKTRHSKQPIEKNPGLEIIPSNTLEVNEA
jgi:hypothetical protein